MINLASLRNRVAWVCILVSGVLSSGSLAATPQTETIVGQHPQVFRQEKPAPAKMDYLLYVPESYQSSQEAWPLVLFLHGAGERGDDVNKVAIHGPPKQAAEGKELPFILASPQCPEGAWWNHAEQMAALSGLVDDLISRFRIDEDRIYLTGLSMGGFGTWSLALAHPDRFAALAPICGGGTAADASKIAHLPIWVFHGAKDGVVPVARSQEMVDALKAAGADVTFTVYPDAGHDSWTQSYDNPALYDWLLKQTRPKPKP